MRNIKPSKSSSKQGNNKDLLLSKEKQVMSSNGFTYLGEGGNDRPPLKVSNKVQKGLIDILSCIFNQDSSMQQSLKKVKALKKDIIEHASIHTGENRIMKIKLVCDILSCIFDQVSKRPSPKQPFCIDLHAAEQSFGVFAPSHPPINLLLLT